MSPSTALLSLSMTILLYDIIDSLECYTCDSWSDKRCTTSAPLTIKNCSMGTEKCLKAIYDTTPLDVVLDELSKNDDRDVTEILQDEDHEMIREEMSRIVRKCYERELFAIPLNVDEEDCDERELRFLKHKFCLCETDLCNAAVAHQSHFLVIVIIVLITI